MSNNLKLGQLIEGEQKRDAIHIAVAPVVAGERLAPGCHIGLNLHGKASTLVDPIGVVDPFLKDSVASGKQFWMFLYPNTVTGLRHEWTHPAFAESKVVTGDAYFSTQWLKRYAVRMNSYDEPDAAYSRLIEGLATGELFAHGSDLHGLYELDEADQLREHASVVLGKPIDFSGFTFSCSC